MAIIRRVLRVVRSLGVEIYFLGLAPIFRAAALPSHAIRRLAPTFHERYQFFLIRLLDALVLPWTRHLQSLREASSDLETYWERYDGMDLGLYAVALGDSSWHRGQRILDLGCGVGRKSFELARDGAAQVVGVDASRRNVLMARKMAGEQENLEFQALDIESLEGYEAHFDYVISFTVFEHLVDVQGTLTHMHRLIKPGGKGVIVFNHYDDKYGSHLKEFISYPWPQMVFAEPLLFRFWNRELRRAHENGEMGYFPRDYQHGLDGHNRDCFMNLNRLTVDGFRALIPGSGFLLVNEDHYSRSPLLMWLPRLERTRVGPYLIGSVTYVLRKSS